MHKKFLIIFLLIFTIIGVFYYVWKKQYVPVMEAKKNIPEFLLKEKNASFKLAPKDALDLIQVGRGEQLEQGVTYEIKGKMLDGTKFALNEAQKNGWFAMAGTKQDMEKKYTVIHFQKYNPTEYMYAVVQEFNNDRTQITIVPVKK
jgi:hypothetical protein